MEIEILEQQCGGTEFVPRPHRLHLGAQNAEGVDRLQFILPAAWAGCTLALYLRRSDGVQLAAIPLDADDSVTVDRRLTGSVRGQWMLAAIGSGGYTAYTRPGSYDAYATLPTDGGSEELPPSVYEQFVARVLESAHAAAESARRAENGAADTAMQAALAQKTADKILADRTDAEASAKRAEAAALRAESYAPTGGQVLSVNSKGGAVQLNAQDVGAVPSPARWCAFSAWMPPPARCRPIPPRCRTCAPMCAARPCLRRQRPARCGQTGSTALRCGQMPP